MIYKHRATGIKATFNFTDSKFYIEGCTIGVTPSLTESNINWEIDTRIPLFKTLDGVLVYEGQPSMWRKGTKI